MLYVSHRCHDPVLDPATCRQDMLWDTPHVDRLGRKYTSLQPSFWFLNLTAKFPDTSTPDPETKSGPSAAAPDEGGVRRGPAHPIACTPVWKAGTCWGKNGAGVE